MFKLISVEKLEGLERDIEKIKGSLRMKPYNQFHFITPPIESYKSETIETIINMIEALFKYLNLEYQTQCKEGLPKIIKKKIKK